jgi:hypothetical protein
MTLSIMVPTCTKIILLDLPEKYMKSEYTNTHERKDMISLFLFFCLFCLEEHFHHIDVLPVAHITETGNLILLDGISVLVLHYLAH